MQLLKPLLPFTLGFLLLVLTYDLTSMALANGVAQLIMFTFVVCLPAWRTGRMSYVDIGWPTGLAIIGLVVIFLSQGDTTRSLVVGLVYLFIGGRMAITALKMWRHGELDDELPRYQYQRLRWNRRRVTNIPFVMQVEVLAQAFANISFLAFPALIIASNPNPELHALELLGLIIWASAFVVEHVSDRQKNAFIREMRNQGLHNQVCDVGFWRYTRHPNYFAEWMVWNGLIIATIPSWLGRYSSDNPIIWVLLGLGLLFVSKIMYTTLVHYTGAKPSEFYSAQKRPAYREYQQTTNRFFPAFPKSKMHS